MSLAPASRPALVQERWLLRKVSTPLTLLALALAGPQRPCICRESPYLLPQASANRHVPAAANSIGSASRQCRRVTRAWSYRDSTQRAWTGLVCWRLEGGRIGRACPRLKLCAHYRALGG